MSKLNEKGSAQIFILITLLFGIVIGVYLIQQRTHILPFAREEAVVQEPSSEEKVISPDRAECGYAPEGFYNLSITIPQAHPFYIKSLCNDSSIEESTVNFGGLLAKEESNLVPTGVGDSIYVEDRLDRVCQSRGLVGSICDLCRQKLDCKSYYIRVKVDKVEGLSCSLDQEGHNQYNFRGKADVKIWSGVPVNMTSTEQPTREQLQLCADIQEEKAVDVNITATYLKEFVPSPY